MSVAWCVKNAIGTNINRIKNGRLSLHVRTNRCFSHPLITWQFKWETETKETRADNILQRTESLWVVGAAAFIANRARRHTFENVIMTRWQMMIKYVKHKKMICLINAQILPRNSCARNINKRHVFKCYFFNLSAYVASNELQIIYL